MQTLSPDTSAEAEHVWIELIRRLTPAQRMQQVLSLNARARALQLAGIRARHPEAGDKELRMRLASLWFDRDTMIRVFGWDPEAHGIG